LGWQRLLAGFPWFQGEGRFPLDAYSEFLPPPRLGRKPYPFAEPEIRPFADDDPDGWQVAEVEEAFQLRPGLLQIARQIHHTLTALARGKAAPGVSLESLRHNLYWSEELTKHIFSAQHERFVTLMPLALSRTQDDKGYVRWSLFGASEQGPSRAFWKSFADKPGREPAEVKAVAFFRSLLHDVYGEDVEDADGLEAVGFRILPHTGATLLPFWRDDPLPKWADRFVLGERDSVKGVRYVLTFRPFDELPDGVRRAYFAGRLHLLPFPGSLIFWGFPKILRWQEKLPFAVQISLMFVVNRHKGPAGIRVPQSGWLHVPHPAHAPKKNGSDDPPQVGEVRNTYKRTHRQARVLRDEDELALMTQADSLLHVLFSTMPSDCGLYSKPMARNVQMCHRDLSPLLDGPNASLRELHAACGIVNEGGLFGYRFQFPPMHVGHHEVYWHRPLVAYRTENDQTAVLPDAPLGYLTAYRANKPQLEKPLELWPRLLRRPEYEAAIELFAQCNHHKYQHGLANVVKVLDTWQLRGETPLPRRLAHQLLCHARTHDFGQWLSHLREMAGDAKPALRLVEHLTEIIEPEDRPLRRMRNGLPESLTYQRTAKRSFEIAYWKMIAYLSEGRYTNKNNADCIRDPVTSLILDHHDRDLDPLGDYILDYYRKEVEKAGMSKKALVGDLPFKWDTAFDYPWMDGWLKSQRPALPERDLIVVIPGRDRSRAVIMSDHYDTAYMVDHYDPHYGGEGARLSACGADDNYSATAAMMLGAPIFLELSKAGKLQYDVWLIHLTGEEFPADCLGARHLAQWLVEDTLKMRLPNGNFFDLSGVQVQGVYVSDMIAHNNNHERDIFQIAPGVGRASLWLAEQAHDATETWNASVPRWNQRPERRGKHRCHRSDDPAVVPKVSPHLAVSGEVRTPYDPRSTIYNTDGQIFSDAGIPVVLFMENYDINREGYHDTHDTMANIDLDYGSAVAAIVIESVARAASTARD
jgi:hypothetical protein